MEIGITGGEEDGVDNTGMDQNKLYTQPEQVSSSHRSHGSNVFVRRDTNNMTVSPAPPASGTVRRA